MDITDWRGNIVFYQSYGTDWRSQLYTKAVQNFTHGPYVHCEIIYAKSAIGWTTIGAHEKAIELAALPHDPTAYTQCTIQTINQDANGNTLPLEPVRLEKALEWAYSKLKTPYSNLDNLRKGITLIFPNLPFEVVVKDRYNCSNFVLAFLQEAGIELPPSFSYPFNASPNDIAEWLGLLRQRKRVTV